MPTYKSTSANVRIWVTLKDPATGKSVRLDPGEVISLDIEVNDPHLAPVADNKPVVARTPKPAAKKVVQKKPVVATKSPSVSSPISAPASSPASSSTSTPSPSTPSSAVSPEETPVEAPKGE